MSMNNKLKFAFRTMLVLPIACLGAFTGCSDFEVTGKNHPVRANPLSHEEENIKKANQLWQGAWWAHEISRSTKVGQDHEKIDNPRVHPGQPYNQGWWPDP